MTYQKILVPIDFSRCSYNALEYAMSFAEKNQAKLVLLNAYHMPIPVADNEIFLNADQMDDFSRISAEKMQELFVTYPQLALLTEEHHTKVAFVTDAILQQAEASQCDLIIMGTHGATNTFDELVGSNTLHAIKRAPIPVLAIPNDYRDSSTKEILFAFDYQPITTKEKIKPLIDLAFTLGAKLHVLHITDNLHKLHESAITEGKVLERYLKGISHTYTMIEAEHIEDGILDYINTHNVGLLSVMSRHHNLFERLFKSSITKQLVHHSSVPIFAFHEE